ncbi:hypothetical protein ACFO3O_01760 [Dokdonia ponticola]|uniref:Uncharacterized protein n=1 Tax=Dokdonia ponticola TaxID=2041041 RepID=A0ABV9HR33_9FLAO
MRHLSRTCLTAGRSGITSRQEHSNIRILLLPKEYVYFYTTVMPNFT